MIAITDDGCLQFKAISTIYNIVTLHVPCFDNGSDIQECGRPQMHLNEMDIIQNKHDVDDDNYLSAKLLPLINMPFAFMYFDAIV